MEQTTVKFAEDAREWLVWSVGGNPRTLNMVLLIALALFAVRFFLLFWREAYTVIDTLNQIWRHITWSLFYAVLFLLCSVQTYYCYLQLFGSLPELSKLKQPDALLDTIGDYIQVGEWFLWARSVYSE